MVGTRVRYLFRDDRTSSLSETMKIGAFADKKKKHFEEPQLDTPFCTFFADPICLNDQNADEDQQRSSAAAPENDRLNGEEETATLRLEERNGNVATSEGLSMHSTNDDFIMVDLKTPFAKASGEKFELGKFFREWQQAPLLETFKELPPLEGQDLQKQLETFESDLNEFDSIVQTLCQSSPNNN